MFNVGSKVDITFVSPMGFLMGEGKGVVVKINNFYAFVQIETEEGGEYSEWLPVSWLS
jgi:hypothetical protein